MDTAKPKKPLGRPPLDPADETVRLIVSLPAREYDALCVQAQRARCSVPEVVRRRLRDGRCEPDA